MMDIVTVYHNNVNLAQADQLWTDLRQYEDPGKFRFYAHSNVRENLGFAKGCNVGAAKGDSEFIGFLNPDVEVRGRFIDLVEEILRLPDVVITGCRFNKPQVELDEWGVKEWVCGAAFFVRRDWWVELGGFDERYVWSHEETDFIRQTEARKKKILPAELPIKHASPTSDSSRDRQYKEVHFAEASKAYREKWKVRRR